MNVAYLMRVDAFDKPGGDLIQVQKILEAGRVGSEHSQPLYTGEIIAEVNPDLSGFDLVHLTNIDRPIDTYSQFLWARSAGKPTVFSTIHHSYAEIERYERLGRGGMTGRLSGVLGFQNVEYVRSIVRAVKYPHLIWPTLRVMVAGMRNTQRAMLHGVQRLLVLTAKERNDILLDFGQVAEARFACVRNGVETPASEAEAGQNDLRDADVCIVGRIEARKNQITILRALNNLGVSGVFVGRENANHRAYCNDFKKLIGDSTSRYVGGLTHAETVRLMRRSRAHVSASWFEVSSLVDIEAYFAGCQVVSSKCGGTHELLGEQALYVDPGSVEDIEQAIRLVLEPSKDGTSSARERQPVSLQTWDDVGLQLAQIYGNVLEKAGQGN